MLDYYPNLQIHAETMLLSRGGLRWFPGTLDEMSTSLVKKTLVKFLISLVGLEESIASSN